MAKGTIDELFDISAIENQKQKAEAILKDFVGSLQKVPKIKLEVEGSKSVKEFSLANAKLSEEIKSVTALAKQRFAADARLITLQTDYAKATARSREELRKSNRELKASTEFQLAETASIDKARAAVKKLTIERNSLNLATAEGQGRRDTLNERINKLNDFIKKNVDLLAQQKINVGNYAGSLAAPFETLLNKLEELKANLANGIGLGGGRSEADLKGATFQIQKLTDALSLSSTAGASSAKQVKILERTFQDLSISTAKGDETATKFLSTLAGQIGEAKDAVGDLRDEIKLNASDTKGIDNVVGSLNALAGIAQGAAGAYALFGASQEDAAKITAKLIAVQGIANSIQTVGQELTRKGTIANKAYVFVQGLVTTATDKSAASTVRLAAASKLLLGGAIIGGIAFLVSKYIELSSRVSEAQRQSALLAETNKEIATNAGSEIAKLQVLYKVATNANIPLVERKKAVGELQEQYPAYFKNIETEAVLQGKAADAYLRAKDAIIEKAKTQALESRLTDLASKELDLQLQNNEKLKEAEKARTAIRKQALAAASENGPKGIAASFGPETSNLRLLQGELKKTEDALKANNITLSEIAKDREFVLGLITNAPVNSASGTGGAAAAIQNAKDIADGTKEAILRSQFEINKLRLEASAASDKEIFESEQRGYFVRVQALNDFTQKQQALALLEVQFARDAEQLRLAAVLKGLEKEKSQKGANIKALTEQQTKERTASAKAIELIELQATIRLGEIGKEFVANSKKLSDDREAIRQEEIDRIKKFEQDQIEIAERSRAIFKAAIAERQADEEKAAQRRIELQKNLQEELKSLFIQLVNDQFTIEEQALTERKRLLDEDTARRINQINLLGLTESERIRQTAIVEKNAAAQTEAIERRKREIAVQRARFEKLASIASIIQATAVAVINALGSKPYSPANIGLAALTGAIGAAQLAKAISTPLPRYKTGRGTGKEELAITGDGGRPEYIVRGSGAIEATPSVPTLTHLMPKDRVLKDDNALLNYLIAASNPYARIVSKSSQQVDVMTDKTGRGIIKAVTENRPKVTVINHAPVEVTASWQNAFKK
jgi:hypothetical protein